MRHDVTFPLNVEVGEIHKLLPTDEPKQRQPFVLLSKEAMGLAPGITLEQGLKPTIAHLTGCSGVAS